MAAVVAIFIIAIVFLPVYYAIQSVWGAIILVAGSLFLYFVYLRRLYRHAKHG